MIQNDKLMNLADGKVLYDDLRGRIESAQLEIDTKPDDVQINGTSILNNGVANVPVASQSSLGVVRQHPNNLGNTGIQILQLSGIDGIIALAKATDDRIKAGSNQNMAIVPYSQHMATFYGLAKAAGDTTQAASSNAVGVYTDDAKDAIKDMLDIIDPVITDVQVNGTSVLDDGVANIPVANANNYGAVRVASEGNIKSGTYVNSAIGCSRQHIATFYGLAKAAGEDMSSSSNNVGVYTETAQSAIHDMLNAPVTVSGTTPSITGKSGIRYECGTVSTLSITPPATGDMEVIFTSGSTPTVLTIPNTVKFPGWFNPSVLRANRTYDIIITNGTLGMVTLWA